MSKAQIAQYLSIGGKVIEILLFLSFAICPPILAYYMLCETDKPFLLSVIMILSAYYGSFLFAIVIKAREFIHKYGDSK